MNDVDKIRHIEAQHQANIEKRIHDFGKQVQPDCNISGCRESAKQRLEGIIKSNLNHVHELQILLNMLPTKLTLEQDIALYNLLCRLK